MGRVAKKSKLIYSPVTIYTDGSFYSTTGSGGWGAYIETDSITTNISGSEINTTNNRMELTAVIKALETLQVPCRVSLYSDSQYVVNMIAKKWINRWAKNGWKSYNIMTGKKKEIKNIDLIKRLYELLQFHQVDAVWVKAHADNNLNNFVDTLARKANDALCRTL